MGGGKGGAEEGDKRRGLQGGTYHAFQCQLPPPASERRPCYYYKAHGGVTIASGEIIDAYSDQIQGLTLKYCPNLRIYDYLR